MTDKPIPTAEAVELVAKQLYGVVSRQEGGVRNHDGSPVPWEDVSPDYLKHGQREVVLDVLVAAYPQIVADVLHHYADRAYGATWKDTAWWLRQRATEVQP